MCRRTHRSPRSLYYVRRAQMYKATRTILADCSKLNQTAGAMLHLAMLDLVDKQHARQAMHIRFLDDFLEDNGGIAFFFSDKAAISDISMCTASRFTSQFLTARIEVSTQVRLRMSIQRYLESLRRTHCWASAHNAHSVAGSTGSLNDGYRNLGPLIEYFEHLREESTKKQNSRLAKTWAQISGAHFCAFSLTMTLVEHTTSPSEVSLFLQYLQHIMDMSIDRDRVPQAGTLIGLHPHAAAHILSQVRIEVFPMVRVGKEVAIMQAIVDAQKMFALLSQGRRDELVGWLIGIVLSLTDKCDAGLPFPSFQDWVSCLEAEIWEAWTARQGTRNRMQ
jgi:hypothetical protein